MFYFCCLVIFVIICDKYVQKGHILRIHEIYKAFYFDTNMKKSVPNVQNIQFVSTKGYGTAIGKEYLYLYALTFTEYPDAADNFNNVLKNENQKTSFTTLTEEIIMNEFIKYVKSIVNASELASMLVFITEFNKQYADIIPIESLPEFTYEINPISNINDPMPDKGIVWEINSICPTMCGMFFENMISYAIGNREECHDLIDCLRDMKCSTKLDTIVNMLKRNDFLKDSTKISISNRKLKYDKNVLNSECFVNKYSYMLWLSMIHFMKYDIRACDYVGCFEIQKYILRNLSYIDEYYKSLKHSTMIQKLKREVDIQHGIHDIKDIALSSEVTINIHGEADFMSNSYITDIKSYKLNTPTTWFAQCWLYEKLLGKQNYKYGYRIINVYSNEVFEFKVL